MKPGTVVIAHPERKAQRALHRFAGATLAPVKVVGDVEGLVGCLDEHAVGIVDVALARAHPELLQHKCRAWICVPGDGGAAADPDAVTALLAAGWSHVIAHPMPLLAEELLSTLQKLQRGDVFGLDKYMAWGAEIRSYTLTDARDREAAVDALAKDVVAVGLPDRIGSLVSVVADELLANALYAAPVDATGKRFRARESREHGRALTGRDIVTVRWATDARYLAIEVRDRWGTLQPGAIGAKLAAGAAQQMTGAMDSVAAAPEGTTADSGMGLPLAYACCTQFVVGTAPGRLTETIALLDVRYKPTELARVASYHAFEGELPEGES